MIIYSWSYKIAPTIDNAEELDENDYIEIKPGKYTGLHWNDGSIFLDEEPFGMLIQSIMKQYPSFEYSSNNDIDHKTWRKIITEFNRILLILKNKPNIQQINSHIGFGFDDSQTQFAKNLNQNISDMIQLIQSLINWIEKTLENNEFISILGVPTQMFDED
ncbi:hypothetical protein SAMN05444392_10785 [Seinonella peptonophila]|uniref:Immunity protein 70 n=1 Tax=Seinonella peptonophila TaxID=112248 RepID=A0A1M4YQ53_9BACL|nr:hypothetical protein [Seinonella peptonophila]SHF07945.1 hypothetical protein SAMN05444392_10785 [Seinonella peptonophila]